MSITFEQAVEALESMFGGSVDREVIGALLESNGEFFFLLHSFFAC